MPGYSDVTLGGIVAYANELKVSELGVPPELIAEHGAVSPEVAEAMASGARERLGADVAVAVTGVAGPGGGTQEKPVGLVYFHAETPDRRPRRLSATRATATRSAGARSSPRSTSCGSLVTES